MNAWINGLTISWIRQSMDAWTDWPLCMNAWINGLTVLQDLVSFGAAAPKKDLNTSLVAQISTSKPKSQPRGLDPNLKAQFPASRPKSQPQSPYPCPLKCALVKINNNHDYNNDYDNYNHDHSELKNECKNASTTYRYQWMLCHQKEFCIKAWFRFKNSSVNASPW